MAAEVRAFVAAADRRGLELEPSDKSKTGFVNVIEVKGKFQARLQVPGDGRGCSKKRKQHPLAGVFDSAEEAAVNLALYKKALKEAGESVASPPKQNKKHTPRQEKQPTAPAAALPPRSSGAFDGLGTAYSCDGRAHPVRHAACATCGCLAASDAAAWLHAAVRDALLISHMCLVYICVNEDNSVNACE